ncbi:hypothetical protein F5B17DRAFT_158926 [Nemania serpens]|nr:hypothetical protein F5B17DRAFT_158926 [Nemania serpens]
MLFIKFRTPVTDPAMTKTNELSIGDVMDVRNVGRVERKREDGAQGMRGGHDMNEDVNDSGLPFSFLFAPQSQFPQCCFANASTAVERERIVKGKEKGSHESGLSISCWWWCNLAQPVPAEGLVRDDTSRRERILAKTQRKDVSRCSYVSGLVYVYMYIYLCGGYYYVKTVVDQCR